MERTFNNTKKVTPDISAETFKQIFEELKVMGVKSQSIYTSDNKVIFSFKGGVNMQINGKLTFTNQTAKLEYYVSPKGSYSNSFANSFVARIGKIF